MISIGRSRRWIVILGGAWSAKIPLAPPAMSMRMPNPKALLRAVLRMGFVPVFLAALERPLRAQTAYTSYDFTTLAGTEGAVGSSDGTGGNGLIAGFVIGGSTPKAVLIRASGPALIPFGVSGTLPDPELQVYSTESASVLAASNTGWGGDAQVATAAACVGAFSWGSSATPDSALLLTLSPGPYTANVTGARGDTGVALIEIYEVQ
jgi:hypothetical protein